ncbi:uncharacterized protein [Primulina eburnea]|uniref:uncharacterized protein n=1 Tax=Primulina eburnea TaxID=1245227 RepID=UPI003C6C722C
MRRVADLSLDQLAQLINRSVDEALRRNRTPSPPPQQLPNHLPPPPPEHLESIWEEVRRLGRQVGGRPPLLDIESPLSPEILNEDLPVNIRQPTVKDYDGSTDPEEHLERFSDSPLLHRYSDGVKCRVFLTTLVGPTQRWFDLLPPHSITSFREFITLFINQYATSKRYLKTSLGLFSLKQGDADSLRDFIRRRNSAALEVPAAATETLVNAFTQVLRVGQFFNSLVKKPPQSYDELLSRAEKYVNLEDAQRQRRVDVLPGDKGKEKVEPSRKRPAERAEERGRGPGPFPYVPLAMSLERAMAICEERRKLERPKQAERGPRLPPSDKFCEFHQEYGHLTNDCQRLGEEVQRIMQRDPHMKNLLARSEIRGQDNRRGRGPPGVNQRPPPTENQPNQGGRNYPPRQQGPQVQQIANDPTPCIIHMITGGATDRDSGRARKAPGRRLESLGLDLAPKADPIISFGPDDLKGIVAPHNDALLVTLTVTNYDVAIIFVDIESSVNILFKRTLDQMKVEGFEFDPISTPLFGFTVHEVQTIGKNHAPLSLGAGLHRITKMTCFTVVDAPSSYNGVVGGDQKSSRRCYVDEVKVEVKRSRTEVGMIVTQPKGISEKEANLDIFVWSSQELRGDSPRVIEHRLNILLEARPIKQKKRHFGPEKDKVIKEQVDELLRAWHIREVFFPTWLSNVVLVPKSSGKWRMCVDFRDLNKACPKDCYPLPRIDQLVDSTAGHQYLCLMDAYQGYHQIPLAEEDQDKVSFITSEGTFCYVVMPFGLKNAGATYQRLMDKVFSAQVGRNVEVYVDDILIKSKGLADLIVDLRETFATLRSYGLKLNPQKCTFGVRSGKLLGYMYGPRTAIKAQTLADFLAETLHVEVEDLWKVYVDGSSTNEGSGVGVLLISPKGDELKLAVRIDFRASNNEAEYEAVLADLRAARQVGAARVHIFSDSQLVAHQMNGSYDVKNERLVEYVKAIPREENEGAVSLAKMASSLHSLKKRDVVVQVELSLSLFSPSLEPEDNDWRAELLGYMKYGELPRDPKKAYRMKWRSLRFILIDGVLYKRSFSQPLLKCLGPKQSNYVLREIHEGCCGNHLGSYFLARKALLGGYFWPTMLKDALAVVSSSPAQKKFLLVAIDYFSKWVEAEALAKITESENNERRATNLDFVEEKREATTIRMEAYKRRIAQTYNKRVIQRSFQVGDLVWKKIQEMEVEKLDPRLEGPFKVVEKLSSGAYYLEDLAGKKLKRPWNAFHLRKYYA